MPRRVYPDLDGFFRANPDMTMQDLATEMGVSLAMMSLLRWGLRQPRLALALRIADRCNIPVESLLLKSTTKAS